MLGEAQDVLLAAETSLARHHNNNRRRTGSRPTEEVPHCLTCCCLDNRRVSCTQRCSSTSSRRHSARRNTTVDELLRQMSFNTPILSDEETYVNVKNELEKRLVQVEDDSAGVESSSPTPLACPPNRCATAIARASSYCEVSKSHETTERSSCEGWSHVQLLDNTSQIRLTKSDNVERSKHQEYSSDGSKRKWPSSDRKKSRRSVQQLLGTGDRNAQPDELLLTKASNNADEEESTSETTIAEKGHIHELKRVRWQFIERIHDEVTKLHRLQQHLDSCCSSPPLVRRRSVSTMTSARLLTTESNVSGQF